MLALRVIITQALYAGDEDPPHACAVYTLRNHRRNMDLEMGYYGGRNSVKQYVLNFLAQDEQRERDVDPLQAKGHWVNKETVNLHHVRDMVARLEAAPSNSPLTSELFSLSGDPVLLDTILKAVDKITDLPEISKKDFEYPPEVPTVVDEKW